MNVLSYIVWNGNPEIFSYGPFSLRWYGLLFAAGFLISQQILFYIHRKEGKPEKDVDTLTIYMIVATIIGARLGHVIFYQPEIIWEDPLGILLPFEFSPEFRFTGLKGLASHGGAIGILFALWLYSRQKITIKSEDGKSELRVPKHPNQNYLQVLDRIVILVALTGCLIRLGNFFNSEILGQPTNFPTGVVFAHQVNQSIAGDPDSPRNPVESLSFGKMEGPKPDSVGYVPIKINIFFTPGYSEPESQYFLRSNVKQKLFFIPDHIYESDNQPLHFRTILDEKTNQVMGRVETIGIARHPAQLYESISCLLLFIFLFSIWWRHKINLPEGRIFGYFMIILWSLRFAYEFLKENQVGFERNLPLNMGQILSIPLVLIGIYILVRSYRKPQGNS